MVERGPAAQQDARPVRHQDLGLECSSSVPRQTASNSTDRRAHRGRTGRAIPIKENARTARHPSRLRIVDQGPHPSKVGPEVNHRSTGASCGSVARLSHAVTEEPCPHSRDPQLAVEVCNVETGHTAASQSDELGSGEGCFQTNTPAYLISENHLERWPWCASASAFASLSVLL